MKKKFAKTSLILLSFLGLTSCNTQGISESIQDTVANALPNLWITLAQLGAFLVMVFVFFRFAFKPLKAKLKERQDYVAKNIRDSEQAKTEAQKSQEIAEKNIQNSRIEANRIITEANKSAEANAQKIVDEANKTADQIRKQGEQDALDAKKQMERQTHDAIVTTAIEASKEILGREINEQDNAKVVDAFIDKLKQEESE